MKPEESPSMRRIAREYFDLQRKIKVKKAIDRILRTQLRFGVRTLVLTLTGKNDCARLLEQQKSWRKKRRAWRCQEVTPDTSTKYDHIRFISQVIRDATGQIVDFTFIHSASVE